MSCERLSGMIFYLPQELSEFAVLLIHPVTYWKNTNILSLVSLFDVHQVCF